MRAPNAFAVALAIALPALAFAPYVLAQGQQKGDGDAKKADADRSATKGGDKGEKKYDPNNVTAISQYMEICVGGNAKYVAKDLAGAIEAYKKAIALAPKAPLAHYLLGEAQLGSGSM